jgi:hypothetical protein
VARERLKREIVNTRARRGPWKGKKKSLKGRRREGFLVS